MPRHVFMVQTECVAGPGEGLQRLVRPGPRARRARGSGLRAGPALRDRRRTSRRDARAPVPRDLRVRGRRPRGGDGRTAQGDADHAHRPLARHGPDRRVRIPPSSARPWRRPRDPARRAPGLPRRRREARRRRSRRLLHRGRHLRDRGAAAGPRRPRRHREDVRRTARPGRGRALRDPRLHRRHLRRAGPRLDRARSTTSPSATAPSRSSAWGSSSWRAAGSRPCATTST